MARRCNARVTGRGYVTARHAHASIVDRQGRPIGVVSWVWPAASEVVSRWKDQRTPGLVVRGTAAGGYQGAGSVGTVLSCRILCVQGVGLV